MINKTLAYLQISADNQDLNNQRLEILEYAQAHDLHIDDFIEIETSSLKNRRARKSEELLHALAAGDSLVVTELSRLGGSTGKVLTVMDELLVNDITLLIIEPNLKLNKRQHELQSSTMISMVSLFAKMERRLMSHRTKETLAAKKAQGIILGKRKGTIQSSMFDKDRQRIVELLSLGVSIRKIALNHLQYGDPSSLNYYVQKRQLVLEAQQYRVSKP
jgi:DNA invertase Pin-like site-specific DNA recombinase